MEVDVDVFKKFVHEVDAADAEYTIESCARQATTWMHQNAARQIWRSC